MKYLLFILLLATSFATRAQGAPTRFDRTHDDFVRLAGGVNAFLARYPTELGLNATAMGRLKSGQITLAYGEYDWTLNRSRP